MKIFVVFIWKRYKRYIIVLFVVSVLTIFLVLLVYTKTIFSVRISLMDKCSSAEDYSKTGVTVAGIKVR